MTKEISDRETDFLCDSIVSSFIGEEMIRQRIACPELGYPESEALYGTIQEWEAATGKSWEDHIKEVNCNNLPPFWWLV